MQFAFWLLKCNYFLESKVTILFQIYFSLYVPKHDDVRVVQIQNSFCQALPPDLAGLMPQEIKPDINIFDVIISP